MVIIFSANRANSRMLVLGDWPFVETDRMHRWAVNKFVLPSISHPLIMYLSFHIYPHVTNSLQLLSLASPLTDFQFLTSESSVLCHSNSCPFLRYSSYSLLFHATLTFKSRASYI
jgi:hypothetical protein